MSFLNNVYKYPKDYIFQKALYDGLVQDLKSVDGYDNKVFEGYSGFNLENMIIGGNSDTNPWQRGYQVRRTVNHGTNGPTGGDSVSGSGGVTDLLYVTDRWFLITENSADFNFLRSDNVPKSEEFSSYFTYYGPNDSTVTEYAWFGTIISTALFEQAKDQNSTLSFWVRSDSSLSGQNMVVSIYKLADGTTWNLPGTIDPPTHTFTTTYTLPGATWTLIEINIDPLSSALDWGEGTDPAIAVIFQLGAMPGTGTTANLNTWETGYYTGYNNASYYETVWNGNVFVSFGDIRLNIGNSRVDSKGRNAKEEELLCRLYSQYIVPKTYSSARTYWQPYKPEVLLYPAIYTGSTASKRFPLLTTPFSTPSGSYTDTFFIDPHTRSGMLLASVASTESPFMVQADYYFGSNT